MDTAENLKPLTDGATGSLLRAEALTVKRGNATLLDGVSVNVEPGELVGVIGPNGAGKSTLLSILAGLERPRQGEVVLDGLAINQFDDNERAQRIGWLEQFAAAHWPVSVEHLVALGRLPFMSGWNRLTDRDHQIVTQAMLATDCHTLAQQRVDTLSGGELTRVMLARVLASEPALILADEPVAALDISHQLQTMQLLREFSSAPKACVVVLHDLTFANHYCDRLYLLDGGRCVAAGTPQEVLTEDNMRNVYGVELSGAHVDGLMGSSASGNGNPQGVTALAPVFRPVKK